MGKEVKGGGLSLGFLSAVVQISGQIDHVAASESSCQSGLNIKCKKTNPQERVMWTDRGFGAQ